MKVLISTGGTAGHVFPALNVARELSVDGHEVVFTCPGGPFSQRIRDLGFFCHPVSARGLRTDSLKSALDSGFSMIKSLDESERILRSFRPHVVAGFGGYGAFPVVLTAAFKKIPTLIHEQNVVPGRANRLLAKLVAQIAVSFTESAAYFRGREVYCTGCPIRPISEPHDTQSYFSELGLVPGRFTMLLLGGSQGSHRLNQVFSGAVSSLAGEKELQVIHLSGPKDQETLLTEYARMGIPYVLKAFMDDMDMAFRVSDLVVCRAGAMTVTELAAYGRPAILVPYPYAGGHQRANAQVLARLGVARIMEEADLTPIRLKDMIINMMDERCPTEELLRRTADVYRPRSASLIASNIARLGAR